MKPIGLSSTEVDELLVDLSTGSLEKRIEAARELGDSGQPRVARNLLDVFDSHDSELRSEAALALGKLHIPESADSLILLLRREPESSVRAKLASALRTSGNVDQGLPLIEHAFREIDPETAAVMIDVAVFIGRPDELLKPLMDLVVNTSEPLVRRACVRAFAALSSPESDAMLKELPGDPDRQVAAIAIAALKKRLKGSELISVFQKRFAQLSVISDRIRLIEEMGNTGMIDFAPLLVKLLDSADVNIKAESIKALGQLRALHNKEIIRKFMSAEESELRRAAIIAINSMGSDESDIPLMMEALHNEDNETADAAEKVLAGVKDSSWLEGLYNSVGKYGSETDLRILRLIEGRKENPPPSIIDYCRGSILVSKPSLQEYMMKLLCRFPDMSYAQIAEKLLESSESTVRNEALSCYRLLKPPGVVQRLIRHFYDESDNRLRARIVLIVGEMKDVTANAFLVECLKDRDARTRGNAIEAVEQSACLEEEEMISVMIPMLRDESNRVVANAACLLWKLGGLRMVELLRAILTKSDNTLQRASAAYALGEIGSIQVVKILLSGLEDPDELVRLNAIKALAKTRDQSVAESLCARYGRETMKVKEEILRALSKLGGNESVKLLVNTANSRDNSQESLRKIAAEGFSDCADSTTIGIILPLADHPDPAVRLAVVDTMMIHGDNNLVQVLTNSLVREQVKMVRDRIKTAISTLKAKK